MNEQGLGEMIKRHNLPRGKKEGKLWRAMNSNVQNDYNTKKKIKKSNSYKKVYAI